MSIVPHMMPENTVGWPDLSAFPPWINLLAGILLAFGVAVVGVAARFGQLSGKNTPREQRADSAQLAMVTLDSTAIREHTHAVLKVSEQLERLNGIGDKYLTSLEERMEAERERAAEQRGYEAGRKSAPASRRNPPKKRGGGGDMNFVQR